MYYRINAIFEISRQTSIRRPLNHADLIPIVVEELRITSEDCRTTIDDMI